MQRAIPFITFVFLSRSILAQAPSGTIEGLVVDPAGAAVAEARVTLASRSTGLRRTLESGSAGTFGFPALPAGSYEVTAQADGFRLLTRMATVEAGTTTTVDFTLVLGDVQEKVTVDDATPQIKYDHHQVGGVVTRGQIENLPLNGRNFLELAKLEPGVTQSLSRPGFNRQFTPVLGAPGSNAGDRTRVTVDGASVMGSGGGAQMNFSQEVVQEFQISTVNYDLSTGIGASGAINIVTRSGGNVLHGGGFFFFRDHKLAAYPALQRAQLNPDPFFQRRQWGLYTAGPILKDRLFFFANLEKNRQRSVFAVQPLTPDFSSFGQIAPSPFDGTQFTIRLDARLNSNTNGFLRYSHDGNSTFAPQGSGSTNNLPSAWLRQLNWVDQGVAGATSTLGAALVNDARFAYMFLSTPQLPADAASCGGCLGAGGPRINIPDASFSIGSSALTSSISRRYSWLDSVTWQKGRHRIHFGVEWEYFTQSAIQLGNEPATMTLWSPAQVRRLAPQIPLPPAFRTAEEILQLPVQSVVVGIGNGRPAWSGFSKVSKANALHLYWQDTWRAHPRLTVNYGLGWSYEPQALNSDLSKPAYLMPILGVDGIRPSRTDPNNFAPSAGLAWTATKDGKTVIRAAAGIYYDPNIFPIPLYMERTELGPFGSGRSNIPGTALLAGGRPIDFPSAPTPFTGSQFLQLLPGIRSALLQRRDPNNRDFAVRNIEADKTGADIFVQDFTTPYAEHVNLGVQREIAKNLILSADFAYRHFVHTFVSGIDANHYNAARGPVIPACVSSQFNDPAAQCSRGSISIDASIGRATYKGLLVKVDKRFSRNLQFVASYAFGSDTGFNGTGNGFNNDNWFESAGPLAFDQRHVLNLSGFIDLPKHFQTSFNASFYSRAPFTAFVGNIDFNCDGTRGDVIPGSRVNQFNRGMGKGDLTQLVTAFNQSLAGSRTSCGMSSQAIPRITLPANYEFGDNYATQDVRLSRVFTYHERYKLTVVGEVFNLLNVANLTGYSGNLANTSTFGQPTNRVGLGFVGSGGPRAFQVAMRVGF